MALLRKTKTVKRKAVATPYAKANRKKTFKWSAKDKQTSTHKTFRGGGIPVITLPTRRKHGHKTFLRK